jgi:hypothetical protein
MVKRILLAGVVAMLGGAAQADHAVAPDAELVPVVTQEVCDYSDSGFGQVRTDCRSSAYPAAKPNPALSGICTIYYGHRVCH